MSKHAVVYCVTGKHIQLTAVSVTSVINNYKGAHLDILIIVARRYGKRYGHNKTNSYCFTKRECNYPFWNPLKK